MGFKPLKSKLKAPVALIASAVVSLPRDPELVPHSKETSTLEAVPRESKLAFKVAPVVVISLASSVVTESGVVPVVKLFSLP